MTWSDRFRPLALLSLALLTAGCHRREPGFVLQDKNLASLSFRRPPESADVTVDNERRPAVLAVPGTWSWRGEVPKQAVLHVGVQALPAVWRAVRRLDVTVAAHDGRTREILEVAGTDGRDPRWLDLEIDLSRWAGREISLDFSADLPGLPPGYRDKNLVAWSPVALERAAPLDRSATAPRPNILFLLVDTLRADHLTPYGYKVHDTSPEIQHRLADHGMVVERAYSQAPWTLPSVVSFLTGRYPGTLLGDNPAAFGIPDRVTPLAERLAALGYETGGFIANPALHAGAGFERGFQTFYAPPADIEWMRKHADSVNRHAVPWLRAHQRRPFFLYVHYVDPHDPYENPDMIGGRAQFMPGYTGAIGTDWIHGIYSGKLPLANPDVDIPYIKALYDGEIHYVDRHIGALLAALDPQALANTLIVLTADHGEELHEHGGWKHGQSLYVEQIHVPLIFRWDGRIPAGRRLQGTVRLLDLVPTLTAAVGGKPDPAWDGINLLPALTGKEAVPRRPSFSEGMSGGPLRAAAVLDRSKLILFNREEPFRPNDELQGYLWQKDLARFQRAELYDLERDPGERRNLADQPPEGPEGLAALDPIINRQLGREMAGLWVLPDGVPEGSRLSGSITFERPPGLWAPYFLGPADRVTLSGATLRFDLLGERLTKGLRIPGDTGRITAVAAALDGKPLPAGAVRTGGDDPWSGRPAQKSAPLLRLWTSRGPAERRTAVDPETEKRLINLGYIGKKRK